MTKIQGSGIVLAALILASRLMWGASAVAAPRDAVVVWGKLDGHTINLFFSRKSGNHWSNPEQISHSGLPEILPAVVGDADGNAWVVWVELHGVNGQLWYRFQRDGVWLPEAPLPADMKTSVAPSLILDKNKVLWLVWTGNDGMDGEDDDIFYTRWNGSGWDSPLKVHENNKVFDFLPDLAVGRDGYPLVTWSTYRDGNIVRRVRHWNGMEWKEEDNAVAAELTMKDFEVVDLPGFIKDRFQVSIFVPGSKRSVNIRRKPR